MGLETSPKSSAEDLTNCFDHVAVVMSQCSLDFVHIFRHTLLRWCPHCGQVEIILADRLGLEIDRTVVGFLHVFAYAYEATQSTHPLSSAPTGAWYSANSIH